MYNQKFLWILQKRNISQKDSSPTLSSVTGRIYNNLRVRWKKEEPLRYLSGLGTFLENVLADKLYNFVNPLGGMGIKKTV